MKNEKKCSGNWWPTSSSMGVGIGGREAQLTDKLDCGGYYIANLV